MERQTLRFLTSMHPAMRPAITLAEGAGMRMENQLNRDALRRLSEAKAPYRPDFQKRHGRGGVVDPARHGAVAAGYEQADERVDRASANPGYRDEKHVTGNGHATIQGGGKHTQLNTDRDISLVPAGGVFDIDNILKVERIKPLKPDGAAMLAADKSIVAFTKVSLTSKEGSTTSFFTLADVNELRVMLNKTTNLNHARIMTPDSKPWFTVHDLMDAVQGNELVMPDKQRAYMAMMGRGVKNPNEPASGGELNRLLYILKALSTNENAQTSKPADDGTAMAKLFPRLFDKRPDPDDAANSYVVTPLETADDPKGVRKAAEAYAVREEWTNSRPALGKIGMRHNLKTAYDQFRQSGGVSVGQYTNAATQEVRVGFRVFQRNNRELLRKPVEDYIAALAQTEANALGDGDNSHYVESLISGERSRLSSLYDDTLNQEKNGIIDMDKLARMDTPPDGMEGDVSISPALFGILHSQIELKHHVLQSDMDYDRLRRLVTSNYSNLKQTYDAATSAAVGHAAAGAREHNKNLKDIYEPEWLNVMRAYDVNMASLSLKEFGKTNMKGWVRLTKTPSGMFNPLEQGAQYILIPPTAHNSNEIIAHYRLKANGGYHDDDAGNYNVSNVLHMLYKDKANATAKIAISKDKVLSLDAVVEGAQSYTDKTIDKGEALRLQDKYGFAEHLASHNGSPVDLAKHYMEEFLKDNNETMAAAGDYKTLTEHLTNSFKQIYCGTQNTPGSVSNVLMQLGTMYLHEDKMQVVFGPNGALYKVVGKHGQARPEIQEIPARVLTSDSLYMRTLNSLMAAAKGQNTGASKISFSANNAFNLAPGSADNKTFLTWAEKIHTNMEDIRALDWHRNLKGIALYSNLQDVLDSEFRGPGKSSYDPAYWKTGANRTENEQRFAARFSVMQDADGLSKLAKDSYDDVVEYVRGIYGEQALHQENFAAKYYQGNMPNEVREVMATEYQAQRNRIIENMQRYSGAWKDAEGAFGVIMGGTKDIRNLNKSIWELESERMSPSLITTASNFLSKVVHDAYVKFTDIFVSTFDLLNPVSILNSFNSAFLDTITAAIHSMFHMLFTNFINKHFAHAPTGKKVATHLFEKLGVKIMNTHELKLLAKLQGSSQLAFTNDWVKFKHERIQRLFPSVYAGAESSGDAGDKEALYQAFTAPEVTIAPSNDKHNSPDFDVVYQLHNRGAFNVPEFGNMDFDSLKDKNVLNKWWHRWGWKMLYPASMLSSYKDPTGRTTDRMNHDIRVGARDYHDPSKFVKVDKDSIRITFNMSSAFGMSPSDEEIFSDRTTEKQRRRLIRTQEERDEGIRQGEMRKNTKANSDKTEGMWRNPLSPSERMAAQDEASVYARQEKARQDNIDRSASIYDQQSAEDSNETPEERRRRLYGH